MTVKEKILEDYGERGPKIAAQLTEEESNSEIRYPDYWSITSWCFYKISHEAEQDAKKILQEIKKQKGRKIVCLGNHDYSWMGSWKSLKNSVWRNGKWCSVLYMLERSLLEYWTATADDWNNLKFFRTSLEEAGKLLGVEITENVLAISCKSGFFDNKLDKKQNRD